MKRRIKIYTMFTGSIIGLAVMAEASDMEFIRMQPQDQSMTLQWLSEAGAHYTFASTNDLAALTNQTAAITNIIAIGDAAPTSTTTSSVTRAVAADQMFFQIQRDPADAQALDRAEATITHIAESTGFVSSGTILTNSGS
ncbi:MAG: hypothetical protein ACI9TH_004242 [Kiritimatiellia bacterium]